MAGRPRRAPPGAPPSPAERMLAAQRRARRRHLRATADDARDAAPHDPARVVRRSPTQRDGAAQEDRALAHLRAAGLRLVARNVACRAGELDLVMRDGALLVFVEVRARRSARFGGAAASVTPAKQQRLARAAQHYLATAWQGAAPRCRFDVVAVSDDAIDWLRDAFTPRYT